MNNLERIISVEFSVCIQTEAKWRSTVATAYYDSVQPIDDAKQANVAPLLRLF